MRVLGRAIIVAALGAAPPATALAQTFQMHVQAVDPEFVVFSAGSQFGHPRDATAQRYLTHGVALANMLRTDRGDDEDGDLGPLEWKHLSVTGCQDEKGDDTVVIVIQPTGSMSATYQDPAPATGC